MCLSNSKSLLTIYSMKKHSLILALAISLPFFFSCNNGPQPCVAPEPEPIEPVEQAPRADPGQNNFGGIIPTTPQAPRDTTGMAERRARQQAAANQIRTVHFNDLSMSDPYILADQATKTYYLTSSGGRQYRSKDLIMWEGPYNVIDISGTWCEKAGFAAAAEITMPEPGATIARSFRQSPEGTTCLTTRLTFSVPRALRDLSFLSQ